MKKVGRRAFLTYCEHFWPSVDSNAENVPIKEEKPIPVFMDWDPNEAAKSLWRGRLGIYNPEKKPDNSMLVQKKE